MLDPENKIGYVRLTHFSRRTGEELREAMEQLQSKGMKALVLDLRLIGLWRRVPLAPLATVVTPIAGTGFVLAIATGICLLATNATEYVGNPFLLIKFGAIVVGAFNVAAVNRSRAWQARGEREPTAGEARQLRALGAVSLVSWLTAVSAGRLIAYW